jgi:hypothetical protein
VGLQKSVVKRAAQANPSNAGSFDRVFVSPLACIKSLILFVLPRLSMLIIEASTRLSSSS